jgi:hypothetical protein
MEQKLYAVAKGRQCPCVCTSWYITYKLVKKFSNCKYRKVESLEEGRKYLNLPESVDMQNYIVTKYDKSKNKSNGKKKHKSKTNNKNKIITTPNIKDERKATEAFWKNRTSSGELKIERYLTINHINFLTQENTLKCINPKTKAVLPYDFELPDYHIIIEVQGPQHFKYIKKFHGSIKGFEYQLYRDGIKKKYAISHNYTYLEITYEQLKDFTYVPIIQQAIKEQTQ